LQYSDFEELISYLENSTKFAYTDSGNPEKIFGLCLNHE